MSAELNSKLGQVRKARDAVAMLLAKSMKQVFDLEVLDKVLKRVRLVIDAWRLLLNPTYDSMRRRFIGVRAYSRRVA